MFDKENIKYTVSRHWNPKSRFLNNKDIYPINYAILYRIFFIIFMSINYEDTIYNEDTF